MTSKRLWYIFGALGLLFILFSVIITVVEYNRFSSAPTVFAAESTIAGVSVGGLVREAANARVTEVYTSPVALYYDQAVIYADPEALGFSMDLDAMLDEAVAKSSSGSFWDHLWKKDQVASVYIALEAAVDETVLADYVTNQIAARYDDPGAPITVIPGTTNLQPGESGRYLELQSAMAEIELALLSPDEREVTLFVMEGPPEALPPEGMYEAFLKHNIDLSGFDGLVEVYMQSMTSDWQIHFAVWDGEPVTPDVAFTAASTIKIPIMISVLRRTSEPTPNSVVTLLENMIVLSENPPADTLMETYLDAVRGPLVVSEDMAALGFENTFLAGYFYLGAPVLQVFETPANMRTDINLDPDIYNQTVPGEAGQLLTAIYQCAENGDGLLIETFPGEITQTECQLMMDILAGNQIGLLIEAGVPPEAVVAHKHGWVQELDGLLHSMSDVAIVFTDGGDYVLNVFIYDETRLDFDQGSRVITRLSQTVYNFFNIDDQAYWWFD